LELHSQGERELGHINALVLQGSVISRTKKFQQALECYEEALKIDPNHFPALVGSGQVLEDIHENSKAKTYFERGYCAGQAWRFRQSDNIL